MKDEIVCAGLALVIGAAQTGLVHGHPEEHNHPESSPPQKTRSIERMMMAGAQANTNVSWDISCDIDPVEYAKVILAIPCQHRE